MHGTTLHLGLRSKVKRQQSFIFKPPTVQPAEPVSVYRRVLLILPGPRRLCVCSGFAMRLQETTIDAAPCECPAYGGTDIHSKPSGAVCRKKNAAAAEQSTEGARCEITRWDERRHCQRPQKRNQDRDRKPDGRGGENLGPGCIAGVGNAEDHYPGDGSLAANTDAKVAARALTFLNLSKRTGQIVGLGRAGAIYKAFRLECVTASRILPPPMKLHPGWMAPALLAIPFSPSPTRMTWFYSRYSFRIRARAATIVIGQLVGIAALTLASILVARLAVQLPEAWLPLLGLAPIALGIRQLVAAEDNGEEAAPMKLNWWVVATVTIANGGDNLGVYIPVFAVQTPLGIAVISACLPCLPLRGAASPLASCGTHAGGRRFGTSPAALLPTCSSR